MRSLHEIPLKADATKKFNIEWELAIPNVTFIKVGDDKRCWCNLAHMGLDVIGADYISINLQSIACTI